jgi:hypothetical protein
MRFSRSARNRTASVRSSNPSTVSSAPGSALPRGPRTGAAHDDHLAAGVALAPLRGPEIEDIVEIDVGQKRRDDRPLRGAHRRRDADRVLQHTDPQPFADQAEDPTVADPPLQKMQQPVMAERVEERPDIGIQDPVHLAGLNRHHHRVERPPSRPEPIGDPEKIFLVDRAQDFDQRPLDNFVLHRGNPREPSAHGLDPWGPLAAVGFCDVVASRRLCPIRTAVNTPVQIGQSGFQPVPVFRPGRLIHPCRRIPFELVVGPAQQIGAEVVQQRGEPRLLSGFAACRMRSSPRDTPARLGVRYVSV